MGICCCRESHYEKPGAPQALDDIAGHVGKDGIITISPTGSITAQPILKNISKEETEGSYNDEFITSMDLCDERTNDLCEASIQLVHVLSIYHGFIANYTESSTANISDLIYKKISEYDILNLRDDHHHTITYHESNTKYMRLLFAKLMEFNAQNDIKSLSKINALLDDDQSSSTYFGHKMDDEIKMIQTLNQIHFDITNEYGSSDTQENNDDTMDSDLVHSEDDDGGDSVNEAADDQISPMLKGIQSHTDRDEKRTTLIIKQNKNQKAVYTQSTTDDIDADR